MILYSIQPIAVWKELQTKLILPADPFQGSHFSTTKEEDSFFAAYSWMREQMGQRLDHYSGQWPWWAWHTWSVNSPRPDLRIERHNYAQGAAFVRLKLDIPDNKVLLSCLDGFTAVINQKPLFFEEAEYDAWEQAFHNVRSGPKITLRDLRKQAESIPYTPEEQAKIDQLNQIRRDTWPRCFDINWMQNSPYWKAGDAIQACFEELRLDQVKKVTLFMGARPHRK